VSPLEYLSVLVTIQEHKQRFQHSLLVFLLLAGVVTGRCWVTKGPKAQESLLRVVLKEGNAYFTSIYRWTRVCLLIEVFVLRVCVFSVAIAIAMLSVVCLFFSCYLMLLLLLLACRVNT